MVNQIGNRFAAHADLKKFTKLIEEHPDFKLPREPLDRAKIEYTRYSSRSPDFDGLVSGFKKIMDALVNLGVLVDDKPVNVGHPKYHWKHAKSGKGKIRIRVSG